MMKTRRLVSLDLGFGPVPKSTVIVTPLARNLLLNDRPGFQCTGVVLRGLRMGQQNIESNRSTKPLHVYMSAKVAGAESVIGQINWLPSERGRFGILDRLI